MAQRKSSRLRLSRWALAFALGAACSSPSVRGGDPAEVGREPAGKVLANYVTRDCKDSKGARFEHPLRVFLIKDSEGFEFLVVAAKGHDSLVIRNRYEDGTERVFQAVLDSNNGHPVLHDYRLQKNGEGRMALAFSFTETESEKGVFRGKVTGAAIACRLAADDEKQADAGAADAT